jgi:hypothetical protein
MKTHINIINKNMYLVNSSTVELTESLNMSKVELGRWFMAALNQWDTTKSFTARINSGEW